MNSGNLQPEFDGSSIDSPNQIRTVELLDVAARNVGRLQFACRRCPCYGRVCKRAIEIVEILERAQERG